jgi:16S rRNA (cytosine1402-N4)-methyltransferase
VRPLAGGLPMSEPEPPSPAFAHLPVMAAEITATFAPVPPGTVVDATVGGGGHARALLDAHRHLDVLGLDRDPVALAASAALAADFPGRVRLRQARFDQLPTAMAELGATELSGALFDLGVSSPQLDDPARGFSYRAAGPLDMRMGPDAARTAADVVNGYEAAELASVLRRHGDERYATRIAAAVVAARPLHTTAELAEVVRDAIPAPARRRGPHPATRTFQAIRIEVNGELEVLAPALDAAVDALAPGGRIAVLSYHSGEDRIVKQRLRAAATGGCTCPPRLPCVCGAEPTVRLVWRGARKATPAEVEANPRASSARLRVAERLGSPAGAPAGGPAGGPAA